MITIADERCCGGNSACLPMSICQAREGRENQIQTMEAVEQLKLALFNEVSAPELLPYAHKTVEALQAAVEEQVKTV